MKINGTFNSNSARLIEIELVKCRDSVLCNTDDQINSFFRKKYLLLLQNQNRFETKSFGENIFRRESILKWIPINTKEVVTIPYKITTTEVQMQDVTMPNDRPIFHFEEMATRPYDEVN